MMESKTVLVTGGAGYIGSHTCKLLDESGYTPVVYDNLVYGHEWAVKWGPLERGDILDNAKLTNVIKKYNPVGVIHFAAYAYVGESIENPAKYYMNNISGTISLLEAMRNTGVRDIVFSSTCATYGIPEVTPISENHPQNPINPYGFTKLVIEHALTDYASGHGFRCGILRYFNAAGAAPDGEIGEDHDPETHLIPLAVRAAFDDTYTLSIFGSDYDTPDGTAIRDYIHVADLASAHVLGLEYLRKIKQSFYVNLGTGIGRSVAEVLDAIERVSGKSVKSTISSRRKGDPPVLVADNSAAKKILSWEPNFKTIDSIVDSAVNWHHKHSNSWGKE